MKVAIAILAVALVGAGVYLLISSRSQAPVPAAPAKATPLLADAPEPAVQPLPLTVQGGTKEHPVAIGPPPRPTAMRRHDIATEIESMENQLKQMREVVAKKDERHEGVSPWLYENAKRDIPKVEARLEILRKEMKE
jgi:hypothetical protein